MKPSLVEWKRTKAGDGCAVDYTLKPSLVEWKPFPAAGIVFRGGALKPSLVEWKQVWWKRRMEWGQP